MLSDAKVATAKYQACQVLLKVVEKRSHYQAGFTLIELIFVIIIVGILSAIAVPSWLSFVSQRRVNVVNDAVLGALQEAQREAKRRKLSYSVSFSTADTELGKVPKVAVHLANTTPTNWENLGKGLELKPGQFLLGTNLVSENTASSALTYAANNVQTITFDYTGSLPRSAQLGSKGLMVAVGVPQTSNSTQALDVTKRCVIVQTLIGSMRIGKGRECNLS